MATIPSVNTRLKGYIFAAQACSCNCDPCVCETPCPCEGADAYLGPRWRFVGDRIEEGTIDGVDVSQRILLNLEQQPSEGSQEWQGAILIDNQATLEQIRALLTLFEARQSSEPAHQERVPVHQRPVYLVPMRYTIIKGRATLCVSFSSISSCTVRSNANEQPLHDWSYNGHVAIQTPLDQWQQAQ
jgi:hypothetical protein